MLNSIHAELDPALDCPTNFLAEMNIDYDNAVAIYYAIFLNY